MFRPSKPARAKRTLPAGFIVPAQPCLHDRAPSGPGWIHELKHDGYRLLALKDGPRVRLWSRQARDFTEHFIQIAAAIAALPVSSAVLDSEALVLRPDGHSDFHGLRSKAGGAAAALVAFDCLSLAGHDLRKCQVETRRDQLRS